MIRVSVYWRNGSKKNRDHEWPDEDWDSAWVTWNGWVEIQSMTHGVLWLTASQSNSDHVVLDRYSQDPPWEESRA